MITTKEYKVPSLANSHLTHKDITVTVPGSKSITNRALLLAMLADGRSILKGALYSDDSRHFLKCLQSLGFETIADETDMRMEIIGLGGKLPQSEASLYVGSAGTAARFLTACLGVSKGTFHLDASAQMKKRPMAPLLASLMELGCEIIFTEKEGYFPFTLKGNGFSKNEISIDINSSSQFLSALLIAASLAKEDIRIHVQGSHGMAYIDMTCKMMEQFGVQCRKLSDGTFIVPAGQKYAALDYNVEYWVSPSP